MRVIRSTPVTIRHKQYQRDLLLTVLQAGAGLVLIALPWVGLLPAAGAGFWIVEFIGLSLLAGGTWFSLSVTAYLYHRRIQERTTELLHQTLGDEFIYFRNLSLPGQRSIGEIDGVLLGPLGAVVIQIENYRGEYAVEGDTWYRYGRGRSVKPATRPLAQLQSGPASLEPRRRLDDSPTWATIRAAREVKAWLSVRGLPQVVVHPLVILGSGKIRTIKRPSAPVIELATLENYLKENLLIKPPVLESEELAGEVVEQIAHRLQSNAD